MDDFSFFTTVGDNIYALNESAPQPEEFEAMLALFEEREAIKDLPIYPVRGNHDCNFPDMYAENKLSATHPTWKFEDLYYQKQWEIGPNGEKFALMQVDSCLLTCEALLSKGFKDIEKFKNAFVNLALPLFVFTEPDPVK